MNAQDVNEWLIADDPEFNVNNGRIIQSVLHGFNNTPSLEEIEKPEKRFSYDTAYLVLQTSPKFFRETASCNLVRVNDGTRVARLHIKKRKESVSPNKRF